jgi:uncharacterized protein (UPF0264 family)
MELLVSVRSEAEAEAALAGGAAVIDVKEPARGSLGCPEPATVAAVVATVAGRRPVSVALGEIRDGNPKSEIRNRKSEISNSLQGLSFVKWGLAGCSGTSWASELEEEAGFLAQIAPKCSAVAVAFADWQKARSPSPEEICHFLCERHWKVFLVDTWGKDGTTLLDWFPLKAIQKLCETCRRHRIRVALAGSLGEKEIRRLRYLEPDWFAVRGAACQQGQRRNSIDPRAVRRLVEVARGRDEG